MQTQYTLLDFRNKKLKPRKTLVNMISTTQLLCPSLSIRLFCNFTVLNCILCFFLFGHSSHINGCAHMRFMSVTHLLFAIRKRKNAIVSTNLKFSEWATMFESQTMVTTLIDRLKFRSHVLNMNSDNPYRAEHTAKASR